MEESVTLKLGRYEALRDKARRVDALEKENKMLKEDLAIVHKHLEELQQPKEDTSTYTVKLDGSEVYEAVKKVADEFKEELEKEEKRQLRKIRDKAMEKWFDERNGVMLCGKTNP
ncbi:hypothetical protein CW665_02480 [Macrococcoides caseolyticum]|uniref:hypothetical protein n=1 Tax=Macrococcoides caseolyticum TaxID=69966 RepID=UPI000C32BCF7|nr:hypothetical protein [Macrococcus caseolyticus]PKE72980.1 hypothetical protein CW665_02480 [Macrococcus caseolyticus]